jgi:hypothetical protein
MNAERATKFGGKIQEVIPARTASITKVGTAITVVPGSAGTLAGRCS